MGDGGSTLADWKKLYEWYRQNTEALEEQVEAVTDDLPKMRNECAALRESTKSMAQTAALIQSEIHKAQQAWDKAEEVASTVGQTAASSATEAVATATQGMVSSLGQATENARNVAGVLKRTVSFNRAFVIAYSLLLVIVCLGCSYVAYRKGASDEKASRKEPSVERSAELMFKGVALEKMYREGTTKDRARLQQLYDRVKKLPQ
ncbi:hypothetical protein [Burkholderia cepacia]|uniref:hypothetical protein n=1 Tax=Burkholderia cepacia TaxID=292 RepID=UPI0012956F0A|nr:hypothetical protein [Burkholderia cepacia]QFS37635.1 hypothetical protein BURCE16_12905 [Burkholderia cepacia]